MSVFVSMRTSSTDYYKLQFVAYKNCFKFPDGSAREEHKKYLAIAAHKYRVCFGDTFFHEEARPRSF